MKNGIGPGQDSDLLREKAKEILKQRAIKADSMPTEGEMIRLNQELQIHQIELEMINNQLNEALAAETQASNKYQGLFDFAPIGYLTLSRGGTIEEVNFNGAQMLGKDRLLIINKQLLLFISEDTRLTYTLFLDRVIETKIKEECELILLSSENSKINVQVSGIASDNGEQCLITMVDITKHKHDEIVLKNSLALTEATLNAVHNGILVVNQFGKVLKTNTKFGEMWHIPEDILASGDDNTLLKSVLDQLSDPDEFLLKVAELYNSPDMSTFDHIQFKDGHIFERISKPMYIDRKPEGRVWSFLDISARIKANTDLQKALWRMESILHGTQAGTWEWNVVTGEIVINETWANIIGYRLEELVPVGIGTWQKYAHPDDLKRSDALLQQHFDGKLSYYDCECRMQHKDGHWIWIHDRGKIVSRTDDGRPHWMFGTHTEITQRKNAESEIKSKNEELSKLVNEKDKFFSIIAHDLRGPLSGFLGLSELMVEDIEVISREELQEYVMGMRNSARNVFRLLENLLEWARMEQGIIPFNPVRLNLNNILSGCVGLLQEYMNMKKVTLVQNVSVDFDVRADRYMLEAIIRNLISNAIKFTQIEGEIVVSAARNNDNRIEISVKDSGIGMNPKMIDHLFELSAKNGRKGTAGEPSTGLGLIICKEFVEKHDGRIWVESIESNGSIFHFTIPN